jgi:hypothetical protein
MNDILSFEEETTDLFDSSVDGADDAIAAIKCFANLFGHTIQITAKENGSDSPPVLPAAALNLNDITEPQRTELERLGALLLSLRQRTTETRATVHILSERLRLESERLLTRQEAQGERLLLELHERSNHLLLNNSLITSYSLMGTSSHPFLYIFCADSIGWRSRPV